MRLISSWKVWLAVAVLTIAVIAVVVQTALFLFSPRFRQEVERQLEERFASSVEIQSFRVSAFPRLRVALDGLVFRHHRRTDVPPLIEVQRVRAAAGWLPLLLARRVGRVDLEGLRIRVPPRKDKKDRADNDDQDSDSSAELRKSSPVVVDRLVANGTILEMLPKKPGKDPLRFDIYELTLREVAADRPMQFDARLKNAKPPGLIVSSGKFGPWEKDEPGDTRVEGEYSFKDADLSVFKGIAGILSSTGKYRGVLAELNVTGETDTPDFMVDAGLHRVHLKTSFNAIVDGTSGETLLKPVRARFGNSVVIANGGVVDVEGVKGKAVRLDVTVPKGRLEDMMKFGVKGEPPMTGNIRYRVKVDLPPGDKPVADKLRLDGRFVVGDALLTKGSLQDKIDRLSEKAQGNPESEPPPGDAESDFSGDFKLADGVIHLSEVAFSIPGAAVRLSGKYGLRSEKLDFRGFVRMDAKVSETTTGWKSLLLKLADPFFGRKDKIRGAEIPIVISGTRENPEFKLDVGKAITPGK
ncbi:MAG: hypothetical protein KIT09_14115 [Bryobacteraceae bacterium]|nr:hypothetical protein [Bryobacteraceae bacterium]